MMIMTIIKEMIAIIIEMIMKMETKMRKVPLFLILIMMKIVIGKEKILV